jgi:16S rRNA (cytosine967-C5)-methyltransferase
VTSPAPDEPAPAALLAAHEPAAEERLRAIPWHGLAGLAPSLDAPLAQVLAGAAADGVLARFLRARRGLPAGGRAASAEAVFGVALWRRRLLAQLGLPGAPPRLLLATLLRDLAGRADAEALAEVPRGTLRPSARPPRSSRSGGRSPTGSPPSSGPPPAKRPRRSPPR